MLDGDPPLRPQRGTSPNFLAYVCCRPTAGWIKIPLGTEVGLGAVDIVLDGDPAPRQKGAQPRIFGPCLLWRTGFMNQDATWYGGRPRPRRHCVTWGPSYPPPKKRGTVPQFFAHVYSGQTSGWIKMLLEGFGPGDIVLDGGPASPLPKKGHSPQFSAHVYCGQTVAHLS